MGDYCKLIVACRVKGDVKKELEHKIEELGLITSAYQSQERIVSIEPGDWLHTKQDLDVVLIGQTKYGRRQDEFCEWLRPHVLQGSGQGDVFALSFNEYSNAPKLWFLMEELKW